MIIVFSGEGPTDLGSTYAGTFSPGPVALMINRWIFKRIGYSLLETNGANYYVCKATLADIAKQLPRAALLRGKKADRGGLSLETRYYFQNARALVAWIREQRLEQPAIALLFRDADGTASAGRGEWEHKVNSVIHGFHFENYPYGVAAIAKPKSEAWFLCAVRYNYANCQSIEASSSGNDASPNSLKQQLEAAMHQRFGCGCSRDDLNQIVSDGLIDEQEIDMQSLNLVKSQCNDVVDLIFGISPRA
ncbi:hypothetical protein VB738_15475 [Cyanobium gracile UHCC 0139]|uniref:Uncharacterized protein n=1 Tax=Cyanobium gracile UHCC 0139 TaxID=3110308 RepID=A0ABU5RY32_9CYAN|nr:hypothetical protein [Cyanobium gracile]MEA5392664.1 hypothetical protein [Cyanobium gracile UHCC 0139]